MHIIKPFLAFKKQAVVFGLMILMLLVFAIPQSYALPAKAEGGLLDTAQENIEPDIVVAKDGSGKFTAVGEALASLNNASKHRIIIFIKDGIYHERVVVNRPNVTLVGQSRKGTRIEFHLASGSPYRGVLNIFADGVILKNMTVANTFPQRRHTFTLYGLGTKVVTIGCDFIANGNDTVSLWTEGGGYFYHADCHFEGNADFLCPHGWCYITNSTFYEVDNHAAIWHDGSHNPNEKFVITKSSFSGARKYSLGRYPRDAQFYLIGCQFSDSTLNIRDNDAKPNPRFNYGRRAYFYNSHRAGSDSAWNADNLASAPGAPKPADITAKWTFDGNWDPERRDAPRVVRVTVHPIYRTVEVLFSEPVTVRGLPVMISKKGRTLKWTAVNGTNKLTFAVLDKGDTPDKMEVRNGAVFASEATAHIRMVNLRLKY